METPTDEHRTTSRTKTRIRHPLLAAAMVAGLGAAVPSAAQTTLRWELELAPYGWLAGIGGEVGIGDRTAEVSTSFGDLLKHLEGALMGVAELRGGRVILRLDAMYVSVGADRAVVIAGGEGELSADLKQVVLQPVVGLTVVSGRGAALDLLAGARYVSLETTLGAATGEGAEADRSRTVQWWDGTAGARARLATGRWRLALSGDVGAGGSNQAWQAVGTASYDLSECCSLVAGYRYLAIDYEQRLLLLDIHMHGPLVALAFRF